MLGRVCAAVVMSFALMVCGSVGWAQVTYELGPKTPLLDAAFYAGQPEDGSDVAGRGLVFHGVSPDGTQVAFAAINVYNGANAVFVVDVGDPSSWRRLGPDVAFRTSPVLFTPDGERVIWGNNIFDVETGMQVASWEEQDDLFPNNLGENAGGPISVTRRVSDNWVAVARDPAGESYQTALAPILPNGEADLSRTAVVVADLTPETPDPSFISFPNISPGGTRMLFSYYTGRALPLADLSDIYVLLDVEPIRNASLLGDGITSSLAPTTISDPRAIAINASANFVHCPQWSQDETLVFTCEDFDNVFNDDDFFGTVAAGEWDIVVSAADGSGSPFRLILAGNQTQITATAGGTRLHFVEDFELYATTFRIIAPLAGTPVGPTEDNVIETTVAHEVEDASGTAVAVASGTTVDFPDGAAQEITIETPIDPVSAPELPDDPFVDAIAVVREFGPDGTAFSPPITISITYTDAEIAGLDESQLRPYLYNENTGKYDTPVPADDIVLRDVDNNRISFRVDHFSKYGLAGSSTANLPLGDWTLCVLVTMGLALVSVAFIRMRSRIC